MAHKVVLALALLLAVSGIESRRSRGYDGGEVKPGKNLKLSRAKTGIRTT
jgi:hypothetical protein